MNPVSAENWQTTAAPIDPQPQGPALLHEPVLPPVVLRKNPKLAAFLALFPGMGHVYNGLYMRGLTFFLVVASLIFIASEKHEEVLFGVAFFWLFNIIDSYRQATLINYGYTQDLGLVDLPRSPKAGQGGLIAGILLCLIGLAAAMESYFDIQLDWLFNLWPLALVGMGLWLIVASMRDRKGAES